MLRSLTLMHVSTVLVSFTGFWYSFELEYDQVEFFSGREYGHTDLAYYNSMDAARVSAHSKTAWVSMRYLKHIARVQPHSKTA